LDRRKLRHTQGGFAEHLVREDPIRALPPGLLCRAVLSEPLAVGIRALQRAAWRASRSRSGSGSGSGSVELSALIAKKVDYRRGFRFDTEFDDALVVLATTTMSNPWSPTSSPWRRRGRP
jgi:hypothetical protein